MSLFLGGYTFGEKVFFTGASESLSSSNKVVHGQQGAVAGPATSDTHKGKGVAVRFPGNTINVECYLTSVRRRRAAPDATNPRLRPHTPRMPMHAAHAFP